MTLPVTSSTADSYKGGGENNPHNYLLAVAAGLEVDEQRDAAPDVVHHLGRHRPRDVRVPVRDRHQVDDGVGRAPDRLKDYDGVDERVQAEDLLRSELLRGERDSPRPRLLGDAEARCRDRCGRCALEGHHA